MQLRPSASARDVADGDGDGLLLTDQNDQLLAPANAGIEQIPLQRRMVLPDDHGQVFRALALVDGRGIGRHQCVELAEPVGDSAAVEAGGELAVVGIDVIDVADVAVVDLLVVIVVNRARYGIVNTIN